MVGPSWTLPALRPTTGGTYQGERMTKCDGAIDVEMKALRSEVETVTSALLRLRTAVNELRIEARKLPTAPQYSPAWRHIDAILQEIEAPDRRRSSSS